MVPTQPRYERMRLHEHLRRGVKLAIVASLHYSGVLSTIRTRVMRDRALVLMYHRVRPRGEGVCDYSPNGMTVSPSEFRMQMEFLLRHYEVVPLARIVAVARGEARAELPLCAVTFDDGWRDVYLHAFPVMKELSIPATVFLTRAFSADGDWHWEERVKFLLASIHGRRRQLAAQVAHSVEDALVVLGAPGLLGQDENGLPGFLSATARGWRNFDSGLRRRRLEQLENLLELAAPGAPREYLDAAEIRALANHGIQFGNHSATHVNLCEVPAQEVLAELKSAERWINETTGARPAYVAYPYGKLDESVRDQAVQAGYSGGFTTRLGLVAAGADPLAINRVNMCSEVAGNEPLFAARILGF